VSALARDLDQIAADTGFSGVVRVDVGEDIEVVRAYGLADRAHAIANEPDTQFGIASGTKGLTALVVMRLVEEGALSLSTPARSILGADLPLVDERVTVEHLLAHRSGIGDYLDEELDLDFTDYLLPVPAQQLATTEAYLDVLDGHPQKFPPGERFAYCNSGYVLLALIAERVAAKPFHDLVRDLVCTPAGMGDTAFLRSDELPGRAAVGYLQVHGTWRTNVFHLPVIGSGDGGIYTTAADVATFWRALFAGSIVREETLAEMLRERSAPGGDYGWGLGFRLPAGGHAVRLEGGDAGVEFATVHDRQRALTWTLLSNTGEGTWAIDARLEQERTAGSPSLPR
jgi:CubicO group peptidase (beta-lactamase class C family)